ncbi:RHS repeat-associated core domain-containing protein [Actinokineospora sp. HUAS TT18]|uniref:RHS repeat-associated core domain-containing protein n=1 Tax=Actinokineospora sp. HUAS TT18 TaxID=3447451 RepID=UPI003F525F2F
MAVATAVAVATTLLSVVPQQAVAADSGPSVQKERSVPGAPVKPVPLPSMAMPKAQPKPVAWPGAQKAIVDTKSTAPGFKRAGAAPLDVATSEHGAKVEVETFDQAAAKKAGIAGVVLRVRDAGGADGAAVPVKLDYSGFAHAYGGDFGSRLKFVSYPACVLTTPEKSACQVATPLKSDNDPQAKELSATVQLGTTALARGAQAAGAETSAATGSAVVAAVATGSGSGGDYSATDLGVAGSWSAGGSGGDFTYSVPLTMPVAPGGPAPSLGLAYSSGGVDGRTSATNSQASWVGDGWDLSAGGFIERQYTACADDDGGNQGSTQTGDLCWKEEHYTVSLGGMSGKLIKDTATGTLRPEKDDGSRIEKLGSFANGYDGSEQWKITTPDGTQYFLGLNKLPGWSAGKPVTNSTFTEPIYGNHGGEPCNQAAFVNSSCTQPYRWNVDLVVDTHGNAMAFYYDQETNHYKRGGPQGVNTAYTAAGRLNRIEYGLRSDNLYAQAPALVAFETAERCLPSGSITCDPAQLNAQTAADHWPDVPFDRVCASGEDCTGRFSPAFFTRKRLTKVVTRSLNNGTHRDVDSWTLRQEFPPTGDGLPRSLWLSGVTRTGHVGGTAATPEIQFYGLAMDNRVDAIDGLLPITRYRVTRVLGEAGALTEVSYAPQDCDRATRMPANPESNTYRCYPTYWTPPGEANPILDWFHKYVVTHITEDARTGGPSQIKTEFQYLGGAAWHYDQNDEEEADKRTWSEWRGYGKVRTVKGDPSGPRTTTETLFLRGMDGDTLPGGGTRDVWVADEGGGNIEDEKRLQGFTRESLLYSGGQVVSASVTEPLLIQTADDGKDTAYMTRVKSVTARSKQENGNWRKTRSNTTYTSIGLPEQVDDEGDIDVSGDESCSKTTYLRNDAAWILVSASSVRLIAKPCSAWPGTDADVVSDVRSSYDGQAHGVAPTKGVVTASQRWTGGTNYQTMSTGKVDAYGRTTETTDSDGVKTTTVYTPATGNPTTVATTNRAGWVATTTLDTARGQTLAEVGINNERADLEYDPLGRLLKVWKPGRSKAAGKSPDAEYSYQYRTDAPTIVTSKALKENETYAVSYDLYDGMLRLRQSQTPALGGGRLLTDNFYDSRGNAFKVNGGYYNPDAPAAVLHGVYDNQVPNQTVTEYDDLGRPLETILKRLDIELWRTKTRYGGDNTYTTPPAGGIATAVIKDARGAVVQRRQYHARSADGTYGAAATFDATDLSYNHKGALAKVTDALGNEWKYEYDLLGRKSADVDPDHGRTTYTYDAEDRLTSTTDAQPKTLAFTYDALGRKTATYEGSTSGTKLADWTYDTLRKGALTSANRYANGNTYTQRVDNYDALGRVTSSSVVIPAAEGKLAGTYTFGASYSSVTGQLLAETKPAAGSLVAENIIHTYNDLGLPESTYGLNTYASEHMYSPYGETLRTTLGVSPNKVWVSSAYTEGTRRIDNIQVKRDSATQPQVTNRTFTYDDNGNVLKIADAPTDGPADTQCFGYDHLRRMTSAWTPKTGDCATQKSVANLGGAAPYWADFTFDKIGNRKTQVKHTAAGDTTETYDNPASGPNAVRPHSLTSVTRVGPTGTSKDEFTYDGAGNTRTRKIGGNTQTLDWNAEGRTSKVTEADGKKSEYIYDANGARLIKKEPNATTLYLPGQELILPTGAANPNGKRYYAHGGEVVAMRSSVAGLQYMLGDHHDTDSASIDAGNLYVTRRYTDPFGNPRGTAPRFWADDKGFVGGTLDSTGLTSVGAREYDPKTGRFASVDPVMDTGDPQQINAYSYSNNNPATFSDPTGLRHPECEERHLHCGTGGALTSPDPATQAYHDKVAKNAKERIYKRDKERLGMQDAEDQARRETGLTEEEQRDAESGKGFWDVMKEELPDIVGDLTGFNDLRDCFTKLDLWACAGIIPWGRILKLIKSAGKIFDAVRKALKWEDRVAAAQAKLHKWRERTMDLMRKGEEKLEDVRDELAAMAGGSCPSPHSFPPGTLVLLADGASKPIEKVELGDVVLATDPETGQSEARKVTATWVHDNEFERTELMVDTDGAAGGRVAAIAATDWHPVWVVDLEAWVPIAEVSVGSWLRTSTGSRVQVSSVRHFSGAGQVYDLTIDGIHAYYVAVGSASILAHNCGSGGASFGDACTCDADQPFVRQGAGWESAGRVQRQAGAAEDTGRFGHGVSVTTPESNERFSRNPADAVTATRADIEAAGFELRYTPTSRDVNHHTLVLPKPVDSGVAGAFNRLFGRKR